MDIYCPCLLPSGNGGLCDARSESICMGGLTSVSPLPPFICECSSLTAGNDPGCCCLKLGVVCCCNPISSKGTSKLVVEDGENVLDRKLAALVARLSFEDEFPEAEGG